MARSLHVRFDDASVAALDVVRAEGLNDSQAVRTALQEAADRRRRRARAGSARQGARAAPCRAIRWWERSVSFAWEQRSPMCWAQEWRHHQRRDL